KRDEGLKDDAVIAIFAKEAKKRQESADLYKQGGNNEKAEAELTEKALIETYLPAQLSEDEVAKLVDEAIAATGASGPAGMGQVIGQVKAKAGASADGAVIARIAKEKLA
ncbi:MAG TPA: GatB/YqeY domain-containing protein, partial [Candidatus Saccharimonadales bacterium]|nr:GatB/YqeY domain-containing protein [Candidatus Saccharimonadales bacterium]